MRKASEEVSEKKSIQFIAVLFVFQNIENIETKKICQKLLVKRVNSFGECDLIISSIKALLVSLVPVIVYVQICLYLEAKHLE